MQKGSHKRRPNYDKSARMSVNLRCCSGQNDLLVCPPALLADEEIIIIVKMEECFLLAHKICAWTTL